MGQLLQRGLKFYLKMEQLFQKGATVLKWGTTHVRNTCNHTKDFRCITFFRKKLKVKKINRKYFKI